MPKKREINLFFDTLKSLRQKAEALGLTEEDVKKRLKLTKGKNEDFKSFRFKRLDWYDEPGTSGNEE